MTPDGEEHILFYAYINSSSNTTAALQHSETL